MKDYNGAIEGLKDFEQGNLKKIISKLEAQAKDMGHKSIKNISLNSSIDSSLLLKLIDLKEAVGQINVDIHAIGIMLMLPQILQRGEVIELLSLGAGNTGKKFDLETNMRIAEFKFIHWKGGPESIRKKSLFKDFYYLAEEKTKKERYLYVLGKEFPDKFLTSSNSISSVLNRNETLRSEFRKHYNDRFTIVSEYYYSKKHLVNIEDMYQIIPSLGINE